MRPENGIIRSLFRSIPNGTLMVQGTTSDAGKSTVVCALGRIFRNYGCAVAPFKSQNMALNSAVTEDGGEIGRAQALQALACGLLLHTDFNPVLLKPNSDVGSQVIINGKPVSHSGGNMKAREYHSFKPIAMQAVLRSHQRLREKYQWVVAEGAGSPAEINLRENDIANMGFAEAVDCPVVLVADIDRGGVFAHLTGTLQCLSESEQQRTIGFIINRFRGDPSLLDSGIRWLEEQTGKPVLGVLPYLHGLYLDGEDALTLTQTQEEGKTRLNIVVPVMPRISNHTDLDPLRAHPEINLILVPPAPEGHDADIPPADLVILPGSKNTRGDLEFLRSQGWQRYLDKHLRYGGKVLGICGGLQMLGETIADPEGIESTSGQSNGFGWLPIQTTLKSDKTLINCEGTLTLPDQDPVRISGYEIHAGLTLSESQSANDSVIVPDDQERLCAVMSEDQQILGSYWHGLMDTPEALQSILKWAGAETQKVDYGLLREESINRLADATEKHIHWDKLTDALTDFYRQRSEHGITVQEIDAQ